MKWITREHPKIDRIACPWLIKRFIDPSDEIIYVPASVVLTKAKKDATKIDKSPSSKFSYITASKYTILSIRPIFEY